ncbi:MAG TPA: DegT/DnrJ/EryC1/StrS family aminotransferase [Polyangiaceae bacterium]|nr:DegT/DnrJ/EryC1/StrS family aminotransferase [Polyangiaceae bacterium]
MTRTDFRVPLVDLTAFHRELRTRAIERFSVVYDSGRFVLGPELRAFESEAAAQLGLAHGVGVSNGTDALVCALAALGIGRGKRIVTTPFTFVATASACLRTGAELQFVDLDPADLNLSPRCFAELDVSKVNAVVPVHLFGHPADVSKLRELAPDCAIVEDAAQAFGARRWGVGLGQHSDAVTFSFFPGKPLGGLGDGGLIGTRDAALAERCRALRTHGRDQRGEIQWLGGNYRLDELQAAILRLKLPHEPRRTAQRAAHARYYCEALSTISEVSSPRTAAGCEPTWSVFSIRVLDGSRDRLKAHLHAAGVETHVYYPRPLHLEPALRDLGYARGDFPEAERASDQVLALPIHAELEPEQLAWVVASIASCYGYPSPDGPAIG